MNETLLKQEIQGFEGCKMQVYLDTMGLPTGGIGHMDKNLLVGTVLSTSQVDAWYQQDVKNALSIAKNSCKFNELSPTRQRVLVQLAFNLGNRLLGFKKFLKALDNKDFKQASIELEDSLWFKQVKQRGTKTCYAILNDCYP